MELKLNNERETLKEIEKRLRNGDLVHMDQFDMGVGCRPHSCGTVACIGGWAWLFENPGDYGGASKFVDQFWRYERYQSPLADLFFPPLEIPYSLITPVQAADAIHNYVTFGKPYWEEVLA